MVTGVTGLVWMMDDLPTLDKGMGKGRVVENVSTRADLGGGVTRSSLRVVDPNGARGGGGFILAYAETVGRVSEDDTEDKYGDCRALVGLPAVELINDGDALRALDEKLADDGLVAGFHPDRVSPPARSRNDGFLTESALFLDENMGDVE